MTRLEKDTKNILRIDNKALRLIPKQITTKEERSNYARTLWNIKKGRKND
tara:strand:- start:140 stop:289 length:150 start_codon:yes stop_codon:yes gene_type:complete